MRRILLGLLAWAWLGAAPPAAAVWVWGPETAAMLADPAQMARMTGFLAARRVKVLYLYAGGDAVPGPVQRDPAPYRALVARLHARGFQVEALLGSGPREARSYVLPERAAEGRALVQGILDYNRRARPAERFDGLHLDIEPYVMEAWTPETETRLAALYLDRAAEWLGLARAADPRLRVGAAIPFWYDHLEVAWGGRLRPLNEHVQDLFDYVALMDYRNHAAGPDGIVALALPELDYADRIGRKVLVGLETAAAEPAKVTFQGPGPEALAREMAAARAGFRGHAGFGGFALHHLGSWMTLLGSR